MNPVSLDEERLQNATAAEIHSALFAQLVTGHAQMALLLLGKTPHPQSGQLEAPDLAGAKVFIDQLEMLAVKTRGNLTDEEASLLKQVLRVTQDAFAEVLDSQLGTDPDAPANPAPETNLVPKHGSALV